ncbi:3-oxoacyl-ACP synthase III family protein [Lutispora sp.]|uniref:3-oxoacyl-ACP synthase III family protein n=1 Tax=Lutispora sp. TaxID=2828727 RepID=UPI002B203A7D|nr:beta-ketoacyl-ACP synthase III [Lutispora sp.]MEA4962225.1 beta-ketoacyl-ACP synthase III [Lutispora sp.]
MMKGVVVCGTGSYVPEEIVTNDELVKTSSIKKEWVENVLGIKERRRIVNGEITSDMAVKASIRALKISDMKPEDIDLIIVGTVTPDRMVPSMATVIQRKLKASKATAYDINAACAGFMFCMITAEQFIKNCYFKNALIIGADAMSTMIDYKDRTCVFFGDGAGAVVLRRSNRKRGLISSYFASDGESKDHVTLFAGNAEYPINYDLLDRRKNYVRMQGKEVGITARRIIPHAINIALEKAQITSNDIDYLIPHQPNISLLRECARAVSIPEEKIVITLDRYANASSANIPIALDHINMEDKLKDGNIIVFVTIGAGWTWASAVLEWGA